MALKFNEIELLSKSKSLQSQNLDAFFLEIGQKLTTCFDLDRVNIWIFEKEKDQNYIECIASYDSLYQKFEKGERLYEKDIPNYFKHLQSDVILNIENTQTSEVCKEIFNLYCKPNNIGAMMDTPIRIEGNLKGVLCYENRNTKRTWTDEEQNFAIAINQIVALALETRERRIVQKKLEKALKEKELLYAEMHHRIKNNLTVLIGLTRLQQKNASDNKIEQLLFDYEKRIFSMMKLHEQLYKTGSYQKINFGLYLSDLIAELKGSFSMLNKKVNFIVEIDDEIYINSDRSVILGLIVNEILSNIQKYAFTKEGEVRIILEMLKDKIHILIEDNGIGFNIDEATKGLGINLINDLKHQIDAEVNIVSQPGVGSTYNVLLN